MKRQNILLFSIPFLFFAQLSTAAVNKKSEETKLLEELTGKKAAPAAAVKALPLSKRHLDAGVVAYKSKNYILALKHYNTVIVKYPKSAEVKSAFLAKAKLYREMGLQEQSELNLKKATEINTTIR
jgi:tetratricopeptide (TPR) repeat protein